MALVVGGIMVEDTTLIQVEEDITEAAEDIVAMIDETIQGALIAEATTTTTDMAMTGATTMMGATTTMTGPTTMTTRATKTKTMRTRATRTAITGATTMALVLIMMIIGDLVISRTMEVAEPMVRDQHARFPKKPRSEIPLRRTTKIGKESDVQPAPLPIIQETSHFWAIRTHTGSTLPIASGQHRVSGTV